jgi:hypothetical protein
LRSRSRILLILTATMFLVVVAIIWVSYRFSMAYPGGDYFIGVWSGGKAFLTDGLSPYSQEVQTQLAAAASDWDVPPLSSRSQFNYPFYVLLTALPAVLIGDYAFSRTLWIFTAFLVILLLVLSAGRLVGWRPKALSLAAILLFTLLNPYTVTAIVAGDFAVLTLLLAVLALQAVRSELDELAGLLLALSTITPHLVIPLLAFITLWAISQRRDRLLLWTYGGLGLLIAGSWLAQRDWIMGYVGVLGDAYRMEGVFTPGQAFQSWWPGFGAQMGWILTAGLGLLLLNEWRLAYGKGPRWFLWTACLTLAAGPLLGLRSDPSSLVIALLPLLLVIGLWDQRWGGRFGWSSALILILLFVGLWAMVPRGIEELTHPNIYPVLFFPLPMITILGLYWVRWLAIRPRGTVLDELRRRGEL